MRARNLLFGLRSAWLICLVTGSLFGCSWKDFIPPHTGVLPNAEAVDHALDLCSITRGEQPFHLRMEITPPAQNAPALPGTAGMQAQIEVWWLNSITYRTEVHSPAFSQIRIVNGPVVYEQDMGSFYPRWLQNFVDAIFDPVPRVSLLRLQPGSVPVATDVHACIANPAGLHDQTAEAEVCFQGEQPLLASGLDFTRYVAFDNFRAFGTQLIPRTLTNDLPANVLVPGRIVMLEPLSRAAYPLLKATRFTPLAQQIHTTLVSSETAELLLQQGPPQPGLGASADIEARIASRPVSYTATAPQEQHATVYVRTDRTGRVREAYTDSADVYGLHRGAAARALGMRFRPLMVNGVPVQMEAPIEVSDAARFEQH